MKMLFTFLFAFASFFSFPAYSAMYMDTLFRIQGSNTIGESLAPSLAVQYLKTLGAENVRIQTLRAKNEKVIKGDLIKQGKSVQILISAHGSSTGFKGLIDDTADIWASSRVVKYKELITVQEFVDLSESASEHVLAIDGLAIVVNPKNPVSVLSKDQLAKIYAGDITNWSEVGGENKAITLFARDHNSGTWDSFKNMVFSKTQRLSSSASRYESSSILVNNVLRDSGAIGFIGMAFVGKSKLLAISDGSAQAQKPSLLSVATEDYALSRRLYFYTLGNNYNHYVHDFLMLSQSTKGQEAVSNEGFMSQNILLIDDIMGRQTEENLPVEYLDLTKDAKRLSVNFRFKPGSSKLDNKALKDIERLLAFMKTQPADKKILLLGFAEKRKNEDRSELLSKLRAMAVRRELSREGVYPKLTKGYGEFNPVASFEGRLSRIKNSRVEVWLQ